MAHTHVFNLDYKPETVILQYSELILILIHDSSMYKLQFAEKLNELKECRTIIPTALVF